MLLLKKRSLPRSRQIIDTLMRTVASQAVCSWRSSLISTLQQRTAQQFYASSIINTAKQSVSIIDTNKNHGTVFFVYRVRA